MQELLYICIFKAINIVHIYFKIHPLSSYNIVVLTLNSPCKTTTMTGEVHEVIHTIMNLDRDKYIGDKKENSNKDITKETTETPSNTDSVKEK